MLYNFDGIHIFCSRPCCWPATINSDPDQNHIKTFHFTEEKLLSIYITVLDILIVNQNMNLTVEWQSTIQKRYEAMIVFKKNVKRLLLNPAFILTKSIGK